MNGEVEEILNTLFSEDYKIDANLVEARSIAIIASIILQEVQEDADK